MTSSQWHLPPKVRVDGELVSKKSLSPKTCKWGTAFLLTACCLALPKAQSSHGLNVPVTWIPRDLVVDLIIAADGWPSSTCRLLMFCLGRAVAETALLFIEFHRKLTPATRWSNIILTQNFYYDVVHIITCNLISSQEFACERKKILPNDKTSLAIEYGPVLFCSLDVPLLEVCPFL